MGSGPVIEIPERGAPPRPVDWPAPMLEGPAVQEGTIPTYLIEEGASPVTQVGTEMQVFEGGEDDRRENCDVVVIGSGAGGAVAAKELAEQGLQVVVVEEGSYFTSNDFKGPPIERIMKMCLAAGSTTSMGRNPISIPIGQTVGGTTTVNSGTCFRAPRRVLDSWAATTGADGLAYEFMEPYYRKVEALLSVRPVPWELLGPTGWLAYDGAQKMGLSGGPILRNISGCHGAGQCAFGCPTDAKQAMHISYLPRAVAAGARIYSRTRAERIVLEGGRAVGITARFMSADRARLGKLRVDARAVVLAGGALGTPMVMKSNRLGRRSRQLGKNLSIHPASGVAGLFKEPVYGWRGTLQPYYIDSLFQSHGVMMEATNSVPSVGASLFPGFGLPTKEVLASYPHIATLGLLVADSSRGRVSRIPTPGGGEAVITYSLGKTDAAKIFEGLAVGAELLLSAGAQTVSAGVAGFDGIQDEQGIERLRQLREGNKLKLSAFHPTGTARLGSSPESSVVDHWLETHEVPGLYITDASVFPSCLGVNPQMTIMALTTRTAERIYEVLN